MTIGKMLDKDVRIAVKQKIIKSHINDPLTLVIDEMGLDYGDNRIDIAVINGQIHGYELKSDSDNLLRLPRQAEAYSAIMDRVTLVVGSKHADDAIKIVPSWWGIKIANQGKRGAINIKTERCGKLNKNVDPHRLLRLMWKEEALALLEHKMTIDWRVRKLRKKEIYDMLVDSYHLSDLRAEVRNTLKSRAGWRSV